MGFWDRFKSKRPEELRKVAHHLGLNYREKDDLGLLRLLLDFKLFKQGGAKKIKNILWEYNPSNDVKTWMFDYQYSVSTGNSHQTFKQSVFFIYSKNLGLPEFYLKPEHFFHKIASWLGKDDIDFDSHQEFSDQYYLKGEHEDIIRETFSGDSLHYFTLEKGWHVEGLNYYLIIYKSKKLLKPQQVEQFYKKALEIYNLLRDGGYKV